MRLLYLLYGFYIINMPHRHTRNTRQGTDRQTRKRKPTALCGEIVSRKNGWIVLSIHGKAYERGFAHGVLLAPELARVIQLLPFFVKQEFHTTIDEYVARCRRIFHKELSDKYREYMDEICGISQGAKIRGTDISEDTLLAWNAFLSMYGEYRNGSSEDSRGGRCSAFIATGNATEKGDIVMAHNTHCDFALASLSNIIVYLTPEKGIPFCMQTCPGLICSSMDWFLCHNGMVGCETTISGIRYKPEFGTPYFCRIRECMQYGNSLDDYAKIMLRDNAGDYACSWLFGDTRTGEIMLFEIGLNHHHLEKTKHGVYYGMNSAISPEIRYHETTDTQYHDWSTSCGARNARLEYLLRVKYAGKINATIAKRILSDHYDVYDGKDRPGARSICKHSELEPQPTKRPAFYPHGAIDGKVLTTAMAKRMSFWGKYGASCNRAFYVKKYLRKNPKYEKWRPYLVDLPNRLWTRIAYP